MFVAIAHVLNHMHLIATVENMLNVCSRIWFGAGDLKTGVAQIHGTTVDANQLETTSNINSIKKRWYYMTTFKLHLNRIC